MMQYLQDAIMQKQKGEMGISIGNACQGMLKIRQRILPAKKLPRFMGES